MVLFGASVRKGKQPPPHPLRLVTISFPFSLTFKLHKPYWKAKSLQNGKRTPTKQGSQASTVDPSHNLILEANWIMHQAPFYQVPLRRPLKFGENEFWNSEFLRTVWSKNRKKNMESLIAIAFHLVYLNTKSS